MENENSEVMVNEQQENTKMTNAELANLAAFMILCNLTATMIYNGIKNGPVLVTLAKEKVKERKAKRLAKKEAKAQDDNFTEEE